MSRYYRLNPDKTVTQYDDGLEWARSFESFKDRQIDDDEIGGIRVSTVFLGLDHNYSEIGPPLIFETMIFGGQFDQEQWRCSTYDEALAQHKEACKLAFRETKGRELDLG